MRTAPKAVILILAAGLSLPALATFVAAGALGQPYEETCGPSDLRPSAATTARNVVVPLSPQGPQATAQWTATQTRNAATVINVARTRALPPRAAVIAVATAIQESSLNNLRHGDRDSVGLFQQRPSQGWGSTDQLTDPVYAASAFYGTLTAIPDWQTKPLADVAQSVQRSAHPSAYAKWEQAASALVTRAWGTHAVTSIFAGCDTDRRHDDPTTAFKVDNPRTPTQAIAAARAAAGQTGWHRMCDRFVANSYGYAYSGSATANEHWIRLVDAGHTHPGDNSPPPGALLFYDNGDAAGHVALYLGKDLVASNDILDSHPGEGKIAIVHRADLTDGPWRLRYRGWAAPSFPGAGGTSTI